MQEHLGGVEDFLRRRKLESLQELERKAPAQSPASAGVLKEKTNYEAAKAQARQSRKVRDRIAWLEHEIGKQEARMQAIEAVLQAPSPSDDIIELTREYLECKRDLDAKTEEWGSLI